MSPVLLGLPFFGIQFSHSFSFHLIFRMEFFTYYVRIA
jgi:hypothetical protein